MGKHWFHSKQKEAEAEQAAAAEAEQAEEVADQPPPYALVETPTTSTPHILDHPGNFELRYPGYSLSAVSYKPDGRKDRQFDVAVFGDVGSNLRTSFSRAVVGHHDFHRSTTITKSLCLGPLQHAFSLRLPGPDQEIKQTQLEQIRSSDGLIVLFETSSPRSFEVAREALSLIVQTKGDDLAWYVAPRLPPVVLVGLVATLGPDRLKVSSEQFKQAAAQSRSALYLLDKEDEATAKLIAEDMAENLVARLELARQMRLQDSGDTKGRASLYKDAPPPMYGVTPPVHGMVEPGYSRGKTFNILLGGDIFEFYKRSVAQTFRDEVSLQREYDFSRVVTVDNQDWHVRLLGSYGAPLGKAGWKKYIPAADAFIIVGGVINLDAVWAVQREFYNDIVSAKYQEWSKTLPSFEKKPIAFIGVSTMLPITKGMQKQSIAMSDTLGAVWSTMRLNKRKEIEATIVGTARELIRRANLDRKN